MNRVFHKNASFWIRLLANIIDITLIAPFLILNFHIAKSNFVIQPNISYYLFWIFNFCIFLFFYIFIPLFFDLRTIGLMITKLQVIYSSPNRKTKIFILRATFNFWFWAALMFLFLMFIRPYDVYEFEKFFKLPESEKKEYKNFRILLFYRVISLIVSAWIVLTIINYLLLIFRKKRLNLIDFISSSRTVYSKHYLKDKSLNNIKIYPKLSNDKTFEYFKE